MREFQGLSEDVYRFFWELAFQNNHEFFETNRERYKTVVQQPLLALVDLLIPKALEIDPDFNVRPSAVLSRIYRDTRYSKDKSPYRDHAWIGFKYPNAMASESFMVYAEFERQSYGYGMGMYAPDSALMQKIRSNILARPQLFLQLVGDPAFATRFEVRGEQYKKRRYLDAAPELQPWLNYRSLSFCYSSADLRRTASAAVADEIKEAFDLMKPVYRFLMGLD